MLHEHFKEFYVQREQQVKSKSEKMEPRNTPAEPSSLQVDTDASVSYFQLFRYSTKVDKFLIFFAIVTTCISGHAVSHTSLIMHNVFKIMRDHEMLQNISTLSDVEHVIMKELNASEPILPVLSNEEFMAAMLDAGFDFCKIALVIFVFSFSGTTAMKISSYNQIFKIRKLYLKAALSQDLAYHDERRDDLASKMGDTVISLEEGINERVTNVVFSIAVIVTNVGVAFSKDWKMTAFSCIILSSLVALIVMSIVVSRRWYVREDEVMDRAGCVADEVLTGMRAVHAFGGQEKEIQRYDSYLQKAKKIFVIREVYISLFLGFGTLVYYVNLGALALYSILIKKFMPDYVNKENYWLNTTTVFINMLQAGLTMRGIATVMKSLGSSLSAGEEIFNLVDKKSKINPLLDEGFELDDCKGNIEFRDVKFYYPSRPNDFVLKGINLSMKPGQIVGLVGQSGSGKSSILRLVSRIYDVTDGTVCVDGYDVRDLSVRWLRSLVGHVTAEPVLLNCTVRENIRYGLEDATDAQIVTAAKQANAHHFIKELPKGYDTVVGERGASLSGGQKQRVAIARALVRDPRLLLLDEATSSLDSASEAIWQESLLKISENRTILIAANHLSMIRNAHKIYVITRGRVVEEGSHDNLMNQKSFYYHIAMLQGFNFDKIENKSAPQVADDDLDSTIDSNESIAELQLGQIKVSNWNVVGLMAKDWILIVLGTFCAGFKNLGIPAMMLFSRAQILVIRIAEINEMLIEAVIFLGKMTAIGFTMGIAAFFQEFMFGLQGARLTYRMRSGLFKHLMYQDLSYFDRRDNSTGALCARISTETADIRRATGQAVSYLVEGLVAMLFMMIIAFIFEIRIVLFFCIFIPLLLVGMYFQGHLYNHDVFDIHKTIEKSTELAAEAVANINLIASLGCERLVLRRHAALLKSAKYQARRSALCCGLITGVSRALTILLIAAIAYYGGTLMVWFKVRHAPIEVIINHIYLMESHYVNALMCMPEVMQGVQASKRILQILKENASVTDPAEPLVKHFKATGNISLTNVFMTYPAQPSTQVLKGLSVDIEAGKTYALAGSNGSGKSSIIKLILRFYDPDAGEVTFDGIPLPSLKLSDVRGSTGVVFEESILFERTILENIAYGDNSRDVPEEEVIEAAVQADIHNFILSLPKGYRTKIGSKGTQLSSGQKQRVALARALVRKPTILLLDDATSLLDPDSEKEVQDALDKAKKGRTVVTVTRSASALRAADVVLTISHGQLAERGTHAELMDRKGLYYTLNKYL